MTIQIVSGTGGYLAADTHANRPAAPSVPTGGIAIYYETDTTDSFYYVPGTGWVLPTASGMATSGSNATSAALDNIANAASDTFTAAQSMPALILTGAAGAGYLHLPPEGGSAPAAVGSTGVTAFFNATGLLSLRREASGISTILDIGSVAASDKTFTFPNVSGTILTTGNEPAFNDLSDVVITSPATNDVLRYDGTNWVNTKAPYTIAFSAPQTAAFTASQVVGHHKFAAAISIGANFASYQGLASEAGGSANATGSTVFNVDKAAAASPNTFSTIGTITFAAGTVTATFATSGGTAQTFAQGDVLRVVAPSSADATFAGFYATLVAART